MDLHEARSAGQAAYSQKPLRQETIKMHEQLARTLGNQAFMAIQRQPDPPPPQPSFDTSPLDAMLDRIQPEYNKMKCLAMDRSVLYNQFQSLLDVKKSLDRHGLREHFMESDEDLENGYESIFSIKDRIQLNELLEINHLHHYLKTQEVSKAYGQLLGWYIKSNDYKKATEFMQYCISSLGDELNYLTEEINPKLEYDIIQLNEALSILPNLNQQYESLINEVYKVFSESQEALVPPPPEPEPEFEPEDPLASIKDQIKGLRATDKKLSNKIIGIENKTRMPKRFRRIPYVQGDIPLFLTSVKVPDGKLPIYTEYFQTKQQLFKVKQQIQNLTPKKRDRGPDGTTEKLRQTKYGFQHSRLSATEEINHWASGFEVQHLLPFAICDDLKIDRSFINGPHNLMMLPAGRGQNQNTTINKDREAHAKARPMHIRPGEQYHNPYNNTIKRYLRKYFPGLYNAATPARQKTEMAKAAAYVVREALKTMQSNDYVDNLEDNVLARIHERFQAYLRCECSEFEQEVIDRSRHHKSNLTRYGMTVHHPPPPK